MALTISHEKYLFIHRRGNLEGIKVSLPLNAIAAHEAREIELLVEELLKSPTVRCVSLTTDETATYRG